MKYLIALSLFFALPNLIFAQEIKTGDAISESRVTTNVSGGEIYTKIEVEANGEKKVFETSEQGEHTLKIQTNGSDEASKGAPVEYVDENEREVTKESNQEEKITQEKNFIQKIVDSISNFFKNIFS